MSKNFSLAEQTLGYQTSTEESNSDLRLLVAGSKNVLIDQQKKVKTRSGYTRLGAANTSLTDIRNAWTWETSTAHKRPMRFYDDELEVYLEDVGGQTIDAWTRVMSGLSTTELLRSCIQKGGNGGWYDTTEKIDLCLMVIADANIYEWNGAVAVVDSITGTEITKKGTTSFGAERFYSTRNMTVVCVRTGTEYTYTGGVTTTTLTGVTPCPDGTDQYQLTQDAVQKFGETNLTTKVRNVAQSFVAGTTSIDGIKLYKAADTGTPTAGFAIVIQADVAGVPSGVNLASANVALVDYLALPIGEFTINFSTPGVITAGQTYWIVVKQVVGNDDSNHFNLGCNSAGGYASGSVKGYNTADGWTPISTVDLYFKTFNNNIITAGDILVQKVVNNSNEPSASRTNHFIHNFENQIIIGSEDDNLVLGSKNTDFKDYTPSSPRVAGEGFTLTLDNPTSAITSLGSNLLIGAGKSVIFKVLFEQLAVGAVVAETAKIKRLEVGVNQGFLNQESIVPVGDAIFYLTNEVALRTIENPDNLTGISPKTLSNPIKPDFDAEDWDNAFGTWYKNTLYYSAPDSSRLYMLNFVEDADGKLLRFWNPPQILPVRALTLIEVDGTEQLYGHSNSVPETYLLFDGGSDGQYDGMEVNEKLPIECRAIYAYNNYKKRGILKNFDEYYVEGEVTPSTTELSTIIRYDYDGVTQQITKNIDGSNEDMLEGEVGYNSLAQQSLAVNPLGGLLYPPSETRKFRVIFEIAKEDFFEIQAEFYSNDVDKYWSIISHGCNVELSKRKSINIKF